MTLTFTPKALWVVGNAHSGGSDDQRAAVMRGGTAGLTAEEAGRTADGRAGFFAAIGAVFEMAAPKRVGPLSDFANGVLLDIGGGWAAVFEGEPAAARAALEGMRAGFEAAIARDGVARHGEQEWEWGELESEFDEAMEYLESGGDEEAEE